MNTGISEQARQGICNYLSVLLANTYTLYLNTQNFHWNVTGAEFYSLHLLFEKQYEDLAEAVDEIAERIRALGFYVEGTFAGFQKRSMIPQEEEVLTSAEMVHRLVHGHEQLICHGRKVAELAEKEGDCATVDLIGRRLGAHEKMVWFLRSHTNLKK